MLTYTDKPQRTQPHKGYIILDSSALLSMCGKAPKEYLTYDHYQEVNQFSRALLLLQDQGYQLVLPTCTLATTCNYAADGVNYSHIYAQSLPMHDQIDAFVRKALEIGAMILPAPKDAKSPQARAQHQLDYGIITKGKKSPAARQFYSDQIIKGALKHFHAERKKFDNFVGPVMQESLAGLPDDGIPAFYVSADGFALKNMAAYSGEKRKIHKLSPWALLSQVIKDPTLAANAGLEHVKLFDSKERYSLERAYKCTSLLGPAINPTTSVIFYVDSVAEFTPKFEYGSREIINITKTKEPFGNAMIALSEELGPVPKTHQAHDETTPSETNGASHGENPRIARFKAMQNKADALRNRNGSSQNGAGSHGGL